MEDYRIKALEILKKFPDSPYKNHLSLWSIMLLKGVSDDIYNFDFISPTFCSVIL